MPGVAQFDYASWALLYPALAGKVSLPAAQAIFDHQAPLYLDNSPTSIVRDTGRRGALLGMLVAHIAQLNLPAEEGGSALVGRVASAGQGSVSVSADMGAVPGSAAWFMQTQAGASYWQATAPYRMARYVPGAPQRRSIWP